MMIIEGKVDWVVVAVVFVANATATTAADNDGDNPATTEFTWDPWWLVVVVTAATAKHMPYNFYLMKHHMIFT